MPPHAGRFAPAIPTDGDAHMPAEWAKFGRTAGRGVVLGLAAAIATQVGTVFFGRNLHAVIPGQAYRSAQLSHDNLIDAVREHGIRTVINLRGTSLDCDWYLDESRATCDADVGQEDITLSAYRLPSPDELRRLVDVFDHAEYPIIFHCRQGVDRTGLAAALLLLLQTDATPAEARQQLGLTYGHIAFGPTWTMLQFFDLYDNWLRTNGRSHSPAAMREFADTGYCPAEFRGRLELAAPPSRLRVGELAAVHVRAINTSLEPWHMHPGTETGVHVKFLVASADWRIVQFGQAGHLEATIQPGESIDLTLAVGPLIAPGPYVLVADLCEGKGFAFSQFGNPPLEISVTVEEQVR
jgi:protein tyrosine phosphatase (PTP) superfamily phosphohydrolase (DUF442 family)